MFCAKSGRSDRRQVGSSRSQNDFGSRRPQVEPEWFSSGPATQADTIELRGFEASEDYGRVYLPAKESGAGDASEQYGMSRGKAKDREKGRTNEGEDRGRENGQSNKEYGQNNKENGQSNKEIGQSHKEIGQSHKEIGQSHKEKGYYKFIAVTFENSTKEC